MVQVVARAWRTMLVTASRSANASTVSSFARRPVLVEGMASHCSVTPAASSVRRAASISATRPRCAVAADSFADLGKRGASGAFDFSDFGGSALRIALDQSAGELCLEHDNGECVAEYIVKVAGRCARVRRVLREQRFLPGLREVCSRRAAAGRRRCCRRR